MTFMTRITGAVALGAALLVGAGLSTPPAQAGYVVILDQVGSDVVASGSGAIDLTGLTFEFPVFFSRTHINPFLSWVEIGEFPASSSLYIGTITGPPNFGTGGPTFSSTGTGNIVSIFPPAPFVTVPTGYISNTLLASSTSTFLNQTFNTLGVTPGTYEWTWGDGPNQNFTLRIGPAAVPEPSSLLLLGGALAGLLLVRVHRRSLDAG